VLLDVMGAVATCCKSYSSEFSHDNVHGADVGTEHVPPRTKLVGLTVVGWRVGVLATACFMP